MDNQNRPRGREKNVTGSSNGVHRRGEGLGTGPVGMGDGYQSRKSGGAGKRAAAGGGGTLILILFILAKLFLGGGSGESTSQNTASQSSGGASALGSVLQLLGGGAGSPSGSFGSYSSGSTQAGTPTSYSSVDRSVASGSRAKRTQIYGNGKDVVTVMVYMCGTDLESQNGMASSDLSEMAAAKFGKNVNLIVYTGGCKRWQTSAISSSTNQIYQVTDGGIKRLVADDGAKAMTDPDTLSSFIKWTAKKYPANRNFLIFWDHGGGSVSGYGYDEKFQRSGSMSLANINKALKAGGVKFDFVGFDACLMATAETALMLNNHADYMIASEETEPGIGWYYTDWLNALGQDTSLSTLDVGQKIVDSFVEQCARRCRGQQTTLSVIDLSEFTNTVPSPLANFSKSITNLISQKEYKTVSDARYTTREFATSSKIDQIDLVDLCKNVGNSEGKALAKALQGAVKYNRTSSNMTDAYGVSIYFPYQRTSYVDKACETYEAIGMDDEYADCIRAFASMEVSGQVATGSSGSASPLGSLLGMAGDMLGSGSSGTSSDAIGQLLGAFLGGGRAGSFMSDRALSNEEKADYISLNYFDRTNLVWNKSGSTVTMALPESQWKLVHSLDLNMFYDDGQGYVDLGLDNVYNFTEDGALVPSTDRTWLAINGQPVAYYHMDTTELGNDQYIITGRVPAMLNGVRVNLILNFDNEHPYGFIAGAQTDYKAKETETVAKNINRIKSGDKIDFICDYYSYDGTYQDSYYLGEQMTITDKIQISNVDVGQGRVKIAYRFTDIYNNEYWSESLEF